MANATHHLAVEVFVCPQCGGTRLLAARADSPAAPFFYCGDLVFDRWEGERPITVWWQLKTPLIDELWSMLMPARA